MREVDSDAPEDKKAYYAMTLADAILHKDEHAVRQLMAMGAPIHEEDEYGFTPLIEACIADSLPIAQLLLEAGADVNGQDATGQTALHWAVENGHLELIQVLLNAGADPNRYTLASQTPLVKAMLREKPDLVKSLIAHGADVDFARDYLNVKVLGHRFALAGRVDIVDAEGNFTEVDYEGFYLEFTLGIIRNALHDFRHHYAAKRLHASFPEVDHVLAALARSQRLIQLQQYNVDRDEHKDLINDLIRAEGPIIIPIAHEGHALTWVYHEGFIAVCDRRQDAHLVDTLGIYRITQPALWTPALIHSMLYQVKPRDFVDERLPALLGLKLHTRMLMPAQIAGNCSWANVEAAVPALHYLLCMKKETEVSDIISIDHPSLAFFHAWRAWDLERELVFCIQSVPEASPARKASKLALLTAILFQRCSADKPLDVQRAKRILSVFPRDAYAYILESYHEIYYRWKKTPAGENLARLIRATKDEPG